MREQLKTRLEKKKMKRIAFVSFSVDIILYIFVTTDNYLHTLLPCYYVYITINYKEVRSHKFS